MAVCLIVSIPGAKLEQYDQVRDALPPLGEGQISHTAGATEDGVCVVDTWDSRADFDRFLQEHLGEQLQRAGFEQPQITEFQIHASVSRD